MQRKVLKKNGYNAGKGKTNQDLIYLHMSSHYRRILNAKKVIDNSPPHSYKTKRPATSNPPAVKNKLNRPFDSPALTDRSASTNSYKGSCWGTESYLGSSRYHSHCIPNDSPNVPVPIERTGIDMDLIDRITYDTKHGPATYCDEGWMEVKGGKTYQPAFDTKHNKSNMNSSNSKNRPPTKGSDSEAAQKQKFVIQKKLESGETGKGNKCFASLGSDSYAKISKPEAVSKLRSLRVYYPPRRKKTRSKMETPSNALEAPGCDCTKICVCDANETAFKKTSISTKEQSQTSSRDSAYNGGVSSLPESRSPTPDHRRKKDCCCCCCEKKQREERPNSSKMADESPRVPDPTLGPPTPKSKAQKHQESLRKMKEDALYVKFVQDITVEVLERNLYTNKALKKVMKKHLRNNLHKLNQERMLQEVENLRIQLGIPEDEALRDLEGDVDEGSIEIVKPYPIISDSEFTLPKNLGNGKKVSEGANCSPRVPKSVSSVLSVCMDDKSAFTSETDEEEVISVIQMKKALGEKRKETCGGKGGAGVSREQFSDDSDRPSDPKKRSTTYSMKQKLIKNYSSSSSDSEMSGEKLSRKARDKTEGDVPASEGLCSREFTHKSSNLSMDRKNRSVSFWHNPDLKVSRTRTVEIKQKKTLTCSRVGSPTNEQDEA